MYLSQQSTSLPSLPFAPAASKPWTNKCVYRHHHSLLLQPSHEVPQQTSSWIHLYLSSRSHTSSFCTQPCSDPSSCSMRIYSTLAFHQLFSPVLPFFYPVPFLSSSQGEQWMWSRKLTRITETFPLSGCDWWSHIIFQTPKYVQDMLNFNTTSNLHGYLVLFVSKTSSVVWYFIMDLILPKVHSYFTLFESKSTVIFICIHCLIISFKLHKFTWTLHEVFLSSNLNSYIMFH